MQGFLRRTGTRVWLAGIALAVVGLATVEAAPGRYLSIDDFLDAVFGQGEREASSLIVDAGLRQQVEALLGRPFPKLRVRYWQRTSSAEPARKTAWVLDEIGKTEPITIGVGIEDGHVATVRVLEFRESRGFEVRYDFFTSQFTGAGLEPDTQLDRRIDGITGATMSVDAVQSVVRLALLLDRHVQENREATARLLR